MVDVLPKKSTVLKKSIAPEEMKHEEEQENDHGYSINIEGTVGAPNQAEHKWWLEENSAAA